MAHTVCPHDCPDTCGITSLVEGDRLVRISGEKSSVTQGFLCVKAHFYVDRVYHPERLLYPMRRVGRKGEGKFARISWDEALDEIATRFKEILARWGGEAIFPYSYSGTLGLINNFGMDKRFFHRLGASRLLRTICTAAGDAGYRYTVGKGIGTDPVGIDRAKVILLWASNLADTGPHLLPLLRQARASGATVVLIDPRRTKTAAFADVHLQPRLATDGALALGMMRVIVDEGLYDADYVERYTLGFDRLRERLREYPVERVSRIVGLPEEQIRWLARLYAKTQPSFIRLGWGMQRHTNGAMATRTVACLPALVGAWRYPGGGILLWNKDAWPVNGQALARPDLTPGNPRSINMVELGRALTSLDPPIRALYVYNSNPAAVAPDQNEVRRGLMREDLFTAVHEIFQTDTADFADILLPATTQFEQTDLHAVMGTWLELNEPVLTPRGEAKSNHETFVLLAERLGFEDQALRDSPLEMVEQVLKGRPYLERITVERLRQEGAVRLCPSDEPSLPFAEGNFPTPSGKCEFYSERMLADGLDPLPAYGPMLESAEGDSELAGRYPLQMVSPASALTTSSSYANMVHERYPEVRPTVEINQDDARARGIVSGDLVRVFNDRGECFLWARVSDATQPGMLVTLKVMWPKLSPGGTNINFTTSQRLSDFGGGATFHSNLVEVEPAPASLAGRETNQEGERARQAAEWRRARGAALVANAR